MIVKKHKTPDKKLVLAVCDTELVGKKFEEGDRVLDLTGEFYKGEEMSEDGVAALFEKAQMVNLVGEKAVQLATEKGLIDKNNIINIKGIPHAQVLRFS